MSRLFYENEKQSRLAQDKPNAVTFKMILDRIKEYFDLRKPWKNPFRKFDKSKK